MHLRDAPYARYQIVHVFAGLRSSTIDAMPEAVADYFRTSVGTRHLPQELRHADLSALAAAATTHLPPGAEPTDLVREVRARAAEFPATLAHSGDRLVLALSHGVFDGTTSTELIGWVVRRAAGECPEMDDRTPVRSPLLSAIRAVGLSSFITLYRKRGLFKLHRVVSAVATEDDRTLRSARFAGFDLDRSALAALSRRDPADGAISTSNMRLTSVLLDVVRDIYTGEDDLPVCIPISLRRYLRSERVEGNFIEVHPLGMLRASDWRPDQISARLKERMDDGTAVAATAYATVRFVLARFFSGGRTNAGRGIRMISVPVVRAPGAIPESIWEPGLPRLISGFVLSGWPSSTLLSLLQFDNFATVTLWDETGQFAVEEFERRLVAEIARRDLVATGPETPA